MSKLYGTLQGCRGEATRCGSASSGIRASVQSWDGSLIAYIDLDENLMPILKLYVSDDSCSSSWGAEKVFEGTFDELKEKLRR